LKKILVINPVADSRWNKTDGDYLKKIAGKDTLIEVVNIEKGPKTIESFYDEAFALPGILRILREIKSQYDGIMINCFADPGLKTAREICDIPVAGPGESAMILASMLGHKFSIVSVKKNMIPMFEMKVASLGLSKRLSSVEYIDMPVSELEDDLNETAKQYGSSGFGLHRHALVVQRGSKKSKYTSCGTCSNSTKNA